MSMYGIYMSASGAQAYSEYLNVVANNIANVDTPGFKREFPVIQARHAEEIARGMATPGMGSINDVGGGVMMQETRTDFTKGNFQQTDNPLDFVINDRSGNTFFVVDKEGQRMLTRAGNFRMSATGQLQTQDGYSVLNSEGGPIQLNPNARTQVGTNGTILQPDIGITHSLALVQPSSVADLVKAGETLFENLGQELPAENQDRNVQSGYLELSTSNSVQEMLEMINVTRSYEANVRMIQSHDQTIGSLIGRLLTTG